MNHSGSPGIRAVDVWDILRSAMVLDGSIGEWARQLARLTELNSLDQLAFFRAVTLGADTTDGAGAIAYSQGGAGFPLHARLTTGNVIDNDTYTVGGNINILTADRRPGGGLGGTLVFEAQIQIEQITDQMGSFGMSVGSRVFGPLIVDAAIFRFDTGVDVNFHTMSYESAVEDQDTGVVVDTDFHIFRIEKTATAVRYYIDGVLVTTHVTEIPDPGDVGETADIVVGIRTEAAAVKYLKYGYVAVWNE